MSTPAHQPALPLMPRGLRARRGSFAAPAIGGVRTGSVQSGIDPKLRNAPEALRKSPAWVDRDL